MRVSATVVALSWIPSESVSGPLRVGFRTGFTHYDPPPPARVEGLAELERLRQADAFRFANALDAWLEVDDAGVVRDSGLGAGSGLVMGSTTVRMSRLEATFRGFSLPTLQTSTPVEGGVRFEQTVGGRTGVPLPRPVPHPPYVAWQAPLVWTTIALTLPSTGAATVELVGASAFPRHSVYGPDGHLVAKSGVTDQARWASHSFGDRTPWGAQDSPAIVAGAESAVERQLAVDIMRGGNPPDVRRHPAGTILIRQGEPGTELHLLLDGIVAVDVDGEQVAEVGPGAVFGERALLEGGVRTATLTAKTAVRVAVTTPTGVDLQRLQELSGEHQREDAGPTEP